MNLKFAVVIVIGLASASQASAQRVSGVGVSRHVTQEFRNSGSTREASSNDINTITRLFASAGLATGGAFLVATIGANMEGPCSCDDPGLQGALLGALTGVTFGASLGAAAPTFGSVCSFGERFGRSFVGSLAGTAVGILTATATHSGIGVLAIPAFAAGGSVASLGPCLRSRGG